MIENSESSNFWTAVAQAVDSSAYRPRRQGHVTAARLEARAAPYYVLKQPDKKNYVRLTEEDYALWWQMNGRKTVKDILFYNFMRYGSLPVGRLSSLVTDLRNGHFLAEKPTQLYQQIEQQLQARAPSSYGRRLLNAFLHTEVSVTGLDPFFTTLYRGLKPLYAWPVQWLLLWVILVGGGFFTGLVWQERFGLTGSSAGYGWSLATLFLANLLVITIHELAHGLTTKFYGRELDRGGFLIYWGFPAFFVDTRDIWLSPRRARIAVSWAGPHSGLVVGGLAGFLLTAVLLFRPEQANALWVTFVYQVGFIAFFSVFINLNPLLELDGYFILMDWLEMPGLRQRAFSFLRRHLWAKLQANLDPRRFWPSLSRAEQVFTLFGVVALVYSGYALLFALYFWQTRVGPLFGDLWRSGPAGQMVTLLLVTAVIVPAIYYLLLFAWAQIRAVLEWLARRDLLHRVAVLAALAGLPLLLVLLLAGLAGPPWTTWLIGLVHLGTIMALATAARQIPGSRFQWALWSLTLAALGLALAWFSPTVAWRAFSLNVTAGALLAAGFVAWFTVNLMPAYGYNRLLVNLALLVGLLAVGSGINWLMADLALTWLILATTTGLALLSPTWLNFWRSRFALPWTLLLLAIACLPLLAVWPLLAAPTAVLWLYAAMLQVLGGGLARFNRATFAARPAGGERQRLINAFSHFVQAMFAGYEPVFGGRRLAAIEAELTQFGYLDKNVSVLEVADYCRAALLLVVDRLDDLAGTPFTARVGQTAYDSLPWPEAETLARHVLSRTAWGVKLAREFIRAHDSRAELFRQADIFAGFDQAGIAELLSVARPWRARKGSTLARAGSDASRFYLIESGEVAVLEEGATVARLEAGGYFGSNALLDSGVYRATYRALTEVRALVIDRERFDPLLRADTTLSSQVSAGAAERELLKRMPLFSSLSPQQLAAVDALLQPRAVAAGEFIISRGQVRSHLFIVMSGQVEAIYKGPDGELVKEQFGPGEHFGEYSLFADIPYLATYRAASDTRLLLLDEPTFDRLVADCTHISHYVEQIGSGRLIQTRRRLDASGIVG